MIYNNTTYTPEQVRNFPVLARTARRDRVVTLHAHPTDATRVISVGLTDDRAALVFADEERNHWYHDLRK